MKNEFNNLLQKEMDRKAFLQHVGIGFAVVTGAATLLKTLNNFGVSNGASSTASTAIGASASYGYGGSSYGGKAAATGQHGAQLTYS